MRHIPAGKVVRSVSMVADITERRHAEERLRKFNEELEIRVKEYTSQLKKRSRQLQRLALALTQAEDKEQAAFFETRQALILNFLQSRQIATFTSASGIPEIKNHSIKAFRIFSRVCR